MSHFEAVPAPCQDRFRPIRRKRMDQMAPNSGVQKGMVSQEQNYQRVSSCLFRHPWHRGRSKCWKLTKDRDEIRVLK